jgi:calcineurin-like phosphoesterase family protein
MSNIFFTSDLHFGHENIIRYASRPFDSIDEMNECLVEMWNSTVTNRDHIYFLGDFSLGLKIDEIYTIIDRLKGKISIIPGNHDKELLKCLNIYHLSGIEILPPLFEWKYHKQWYIMCHFPLCSWNRMHREKPSIHLHGHMHSSNPVTRIPINDSRYTDIPNTYRIDVGYDANKRILSIDEVNELCMSC